MPEQMMQDGFPAGLSDKLGSILSNPALMRGIMSLIPTASDRDTAAESSPVAAEVEAVAEEGEDVGVTGGGSATGDTDAVGRSALIPTAGAVTEKSERPDPAALFAALRPFLSSARRDRLDRLCSLTGLLGAMGAVGAVTGESRRSGVGEGEERV